MKPLNFLKFSRILISLALVAVIASCSKEKLSDDKITNFVKAYENLAAAGPRLKQKLGGAQDGSSCGECEAILEEAATKAGYEDYDAFLADDGRIRGAVTFIQLKETFGKAQKGMNKMTDEKNCMQMMAAQKDLSEEEKKQKCESMAKGMGAAQGAMSAVGSVMEFFVDEEDVEAVRPHVDKIDRAINHAGLRCEFDFTCKDKNVTPQMDGQM